MDTPWHLRLNKAMKRNIKRFPENFCFQLTDKECSKIQIGSLNGGRGTNIKYLPYAYTEQGVAMLTSALHTDKAIEASILIMEAFVEMSHIIRQNAGLLPQQEIRLLAHRQDELQDEVKDIKDNMITKADLTDIMKLFESGISSEEILIIDGEPFKADMAYQKIYKKAKKNIIMIDDYLGVKTLHHLSHVKAGVGITIISDNKGRTTLRLSEYNDYITEYPGQNISFIKSSNRTHDRYIILDYGTKTMKVYHCGASSKDAGRKITTITEIKEGEIYKDTVKTLLMNPPLVLN